MTIIKNFLWLKDKIFYPMNDIKIKITILFISKTAFV